jgi:Fe2+ or Zn2+ uptake regulation protein
MLSDIDHPYAAKRPPIDTDYFETFNRDNVALVDLKAEPIEQWARSVAAEHGFTDPHHLVDVFGLCASCALEL